MKLSSQPTESGENLTTLTALISVITSSFHCSLSNDGRFVTELSSTCFTMSQTVQHWDALREVGGDHGALLCLAHHGQGGSKGRGQAGEQVFVLPGEEDVLPG